LKPDEKAGRMDRRKLNPHMERKKLDPMAAPTPDLKLFELSPSASSFRASPKRSRTEAIGVAELFPYYAGYSYAWALDQIRSLHLDASHLVLDPWNGSGTTTSAAADYGVPSVGIDLNPVASVVAQARVPGKMTDAALSSEYPTVTPVRLGQRDPLRSWFTPRAGLQIRRWATTFESLEAPDRNLGLLSLFVLVRRWTKSFEGSNPTWVRRARKSNEKVDVLPATVDDAVRRQLQDVRDYLIDKETPTSTPKIITGSSKEVPLEMATVDAIVTSPPYLTRIDYAVAYSRELAVLGFDIGGTSRALRSSLMGTTLIRPDEPNEAIRNVGGDLAKALLQDIAEHPSKDSSGYYLKQAKQYISDLTASIAEVTRVAKPGALFIAVVQDSFYKEVQVRLAEILVEESQALGWQHEGTEAFPVSRILTSINTQAMAYAKSQVSESVVYLRRSSDA